MKDDDFGFVSDDCYGFVDPFWGVSHEFLGVSNEGWHPPQTKDGWHGSVK